MKRTIILQLLVYLVQVHLLGVQMALQEFGWALFGHARG